MQQQRLHKDHVTGIGLAGEWIACTAFRVDLAIAQSSAAVRPWQDSQGAVVGAARIQVDADGDHAVEYIQPHPLRAKLAEATMERPAHCPSHNSFVHARDDEALELNILMPRVDATQNQLTHGNAVSFGDPVFVRSARDRLLVLLA